MQAGRCCPARVDGVRDHCWAHQLPGGSLMLGRRKRFEVLADFIAEHFPRPQTDTVLDVGGSTGVLAYHLARLGYQVTVIDPRRPAVKRHFRKLAAKAGFLSRMRYEQRPLLPTDSADLLVGLHPDEVTEAIVRQAVRIGAGFVVVPCCVLPEDEMRRSFDQWCEHLASLARATHQVQEATLCVCGANRVIWAPAPTIPGAGAAAAVDLAQKPGI